MRSTIVHKKKRGQQKKWLGIATTKGVLYSGKSSKAADHYSKGKRNVKKNDTEE